MANKQIAPGLYAVELTPDEHRAKYSVSSKATSVLKGSDASQSVAVVVEQVFSKALSAVADTRVSQTSGHRPPRSRRTRR